MPACGAQPAHRIDGIDARKPTRRGVLEDASNRPSHLPMSLHERQLNIHGVYYNLVYYPPGPPGFRGLNLSKATQMC